MCLTLMILPQPKQAFVPEEGFKYSCQRDTTIKAF